MPQKEREGATLIHDRTPPMVLAQAALELVGRDPGGAATAADEAVDAAKVSHDPAARAVALRARSLAERELGRIPAALRSGQASVRAAAAAGDDDLEAEARMSLAFVLLERGSVTAALRQADRSAGQTQGLAAARLSTQRALILQRTGRGAEALAAYAQALPVLRRGHDTVWEARLRNNRGLLHAYHGSLRDAEADLRVALALHESAGASLSAADSWWNLGFVAARKGDAPTALQHFDAAAEIYRRHGLPVQELMLDRVELLLGVGAVGEARRTARRAVASLEAAALGLHLPEALLLLAQATIADGRPDEASPVAAEAARLFTVQGRSAWAVLARYVGVLADQRAGHHSASLLRESLAVAESLRLSRWRVHELDIRLTAAQLAMTRGDRLLAAEQLKSASEARSAGPPAVRLRGWYAEALLRLEDGRPEAAERALRAGMTHLERHRAAMGATELRMHVAGHGRDLASLGLRLAAEARSPVRVLAWAERWRAGALRLRPVRPPRERELAETLAELRRATADAEQARLAGESARHQDTLVDHLEAQVRAHARRASGRPWSGTGLPTPTVPALRSALGGAALVELVRLDDRLMAVTVNQRRSHLADLGDATPVTAAAEALAHAVRRLAAADSPAVLDRAAETLRGAAGALDTQLFGPLRADVGDRPLVLVPTAALQSVPWSLLPSLAGRPVNVAPSAAIWLSSTTAGRRDGTEVVALAGPGLAAADREVREVARTRGARAVTGEEATAAAVLSAMATADTVHIAAHGRLRTDNPMLSALEMADGPLTIYDLEQLDATARLVLLPACRSGQPSVHAGDEVMGLAQVLLALGSQTVIATVVPVPDEATHPLMVDLHARLAAGARPAEALTAAQLAVGTDDPAARAAAAGFVCFGDG